MNPIKKPAHNFQQGEGGRRGGLRGRGQQNKDRNGLFLAPTPSVENFLEEKLTDEQTDGLS
jgi:hypothetical protein